MDIADEESPRRYPYTGKRYEGQNDFMQQQQQPEANDVDWNGEENVDFDAIDDNVVICYDEICRQTNNTVAVVEQDPQMRKTVVNRYGCGHLEEEFGDSNGALLQLPKRQMTIIEEVTSSV